jgi:AcrR family transcriptional regulator
MNANEAAADAATDSPSSWREMAVARSLDPARVRAENRVMRFLDAALELMTSSRGKDFTVQEVVERSGQSLRSFYQYFAGKYELLLALFEESVRSTADHLESVIETDDDAMGRLRLFTLEYHRLCQPAGKGTTSKQHPTRAMAEFAQQLLTEHPQEAARAFVPLVSLLHGLLDAAVEEGTVRSDLDNRRIAGVILQTVMFNPFAAVISGASPVNGTEAAEELWSVILDGIGVES